MAELIDTGYN